MEDSWRDKLQQSSRHPNLPFELQLGAGPPVVVEHWLRILPGKRYVGRAQMAGQTVVVKLFVGSRASVKAKREVEGIHRLQQAQLHIPDLLEHGDDGRAAWVVTAYIGGAQTLFDAADLSVDANFSPSYSDSPDDQTLSFALSVVRAVAEMHLKGLIQADIHPGNFLINSVPNQSCCWVIDPADVVSEASKQGALENIALFLAQLPEIWWSQLLRTYCEITDSEANCDKVRALAWQAQARRAADLAHKSVRDCTLFKVQQDWRHFVALWREDEALLGPLLDDLDGWISRSKILKDGGSATVALADYQGRELVIKRYNLKSWSHRVKRFWRPTRAWHSWMAGHRLRVIGINSPKPLAMVEHRWGPLRGRGYLVTEKAEGLDLLAQDSASTSFEQVAAAIRRMLELFRRHRISHGDLKGTNLLWSSELEVIDLDAIRWHRNTARWQRAYQKDCDRLQRNWQSGSAEYEHIAAAIGSSS